MACRLYIVREGMLLHEWACSETTVVQLAELAAAIWRLDLPIDAEDEKCCTLMTQRLLDDSSYAARRAATHILPTLSKLCRDQVRAAEQGDMHMQYILPHPGVLDTSELPM